MLWSADMVPIELETTVTLEDVDGDDDDDDISGTMTSRVKSAICSAHV